MQTGKDSEVFQEKKPRFGLAVDLHQMQATVNDPSAGSPTETLLRLLLPLDVQVCSSFRHATDRMLPSIPGPIRGAH